MKRFIGSLKANKNDIKLTYKRPKSWELLVAVDSNYAANTDDRRSITGVLVTIGGTLVSWTSKPQGTVSLSSTEAEYQALCFATQEVRFIQQLLEELHLDIGPAHVYEDNQGAIFLVKNHQVGNRTKHFHVKMHYVREQYNAGHLMIHYVKSEDNPSDILTKNVMNKDHLKIAKMIREGNLKFEETKMDRT